MAYKLPFVFVRRDYFNEEPFLRNMLEVIFFFSFIIHGDIISNAMEFVLVGLIFELLFCAVLPWRG